MTNLGTVTVICLNGSGSSGGKYLFLADGLATMRIGLRNGYPVKDVTTTALGFAGVQNTDWICLEGE